MIIVTFAQTSAWEKNGVHTAVQKYVEAPANSAGVQISAIATNVQDDKGNPISYAQAAWALAYLSNGVTNYKFIALPTIDSEIPLATAANSLI